MPSATACARRRNSAAILNPSNCLLRGMAGTYTRASGEVDWRRTFVTDNGQMITPFLQLRASTSLRLDVTTSRASRTSSATGRANRPAPCRPSASNIAIPSSTFEPWGTQTIEPIAQLIMRPNETADRQIPQRRRAEPGLQRPPICSRSTSFPAGIASRAAAALNAGVQYTAQFNRAGSLNVLFGQSYQLFGLNSFAVADLTNTGLESGLDKPISDYVGERHVSAEPNLHFHRPRAVRRGDLHAGAPRIGKPRQLRSLDAATALWRLRRTAGDRLPDAARGASWPGPRSR